MTWLPLTIDRFQDSIRRAQASRAAQQYENAIREYRQAMEARGEDLASEEAIDVCVRIAECNIELGDMDAAALALHEAEVHGADQAKAALRGAFHCARGYIALNRARYEETVREATFAWDALRNTGENALLAKALNCRGHGLRRLGRLADAQEDYLDAMAAARRAQDAHEIGLASSNLGFLLWQSGRYAEARAHHRRAVAIHEETGSETHVTREIFALAIDEYHCGSWKESSALLDRCGERARNRQDRRLEIAVAIAQARLLLAQGEDPRELLETARRAAAEHGYAHDLVLIGQLEGEAAMERGEREEASRILEEAWRRAKVASAKGEPGGDAAWRLALAEELLGDPHHRVLDLLHQALEVATAREYRALEAIVRRVLAFALARRDQHAEAWRNFEISIAILRELRLPYETGRSLAAWGEALAEAGETSGALVALRDARAIFAGLGAVRELRKADDLLAACTHVSEERVEVEAKLDASPSDPFSRIVTNSLSMNEAIARARRIAPSRIPVLLTGETGTGKELFARAIHDASPVRKRPFLAVNCAALTETLLESELFGHTKGAFTGAVADRIGIFEAAQGGTVFLDEIGKAPLSLQAKLLRVVDSGELRRVGGTEVVHVEVRIIAAGNRDLLSLLGSGDFLPDLYYRLRGFEIRIAPLRERIEDIELLFERFAGRPVSKPALEVLEAYEWPGNVREMRHVAESTAFLTGGMGAISRDALPDWIRQDPEDAVKKIRSMREIQKSALLDALAKFGGNRSRAARELGISRQTLYSRLSKLGLAAT
ncbi:MAG TPA: sigma 54-interacting transcriptional regulator [bacterium]|nr:sigma 54-interacting transcriptional regulator [bacterium]